MTKRLIGLVAITVDVRGRAGAGGPARRRRVFGDASRGPTVRSSATAVPTLARASSDVGDIATVIIAGYEGSHHDSVHARIEVKG